MVLVAEGRRIDAWTGPAAAPPASVVAEMTRLAAADVERLGLDIADRAPPSRPDAASPKPRPLPAQDLGQPVALKIASPQISHKTDVGGVVLGLPSPTEVLAAANAMLARIRSRRPDATIQGILVQPMAPAGKELLLGAVHDAQFGPLVMVGFGGIYVEVLRDTATRLVPVSPAEALRMLGELKMAALLRGVRGEPAVDLQPWRRPSPLDSSSWTARISRGWAEPRATPTGVSPSTPGLAAPSTRPSTRSPARPAS
jgi:hypothetical protein